MADTYRVERKIRIDAPASAVYERIIDFHRWPAWSPYEELDPGMDRTYAGSESGLGAVYEWSGNLKAGAGRMEIVDAVDDERTGDAHHADHGHLQVHGSDGRPGLREGTGEPQGRRRG